MSDRYKGCVVTFDRDFRDDDCKSLSEAICQLKGVAGVTLVLTNPDDHMNRTRIRLELQGQVMRAFAPPPDWL